MTTIKTTSGSTYFVCEGRISRINIRPIVGAEDLMVAGDCFRWITPPQVGKSARFIINGIADAITTTPVLEVITL